MRIFITFFILFSLSFSANSSIAVSQFDDSSFDSFEDDFGSIQVDNDKFDDYNHLMTGFNDNLYKYILHPLAIGHAYVFPNIVRLKISNVLDNLRYPIRLANNMLQFKIFNSIEETLRFGINSTVGIFGLFDVAKTFGLQPHDEDFGQTLAYYNVSEGYYIVLPIFGPSNIRDTIGLIVDMGLYIVYPLLQANITNSSELSSYRLYFIGMKGLDMVNDVSLNPDVYDNIKKDAIDLNQLLKTIYNQARKSQIEE